VPGRAGQGPAFQLGALSSPAGLRLLCLLTEATADALKAGEIYPSPDAGRAAADDPDIARLEAVVGAFVRRVYAEISPALLEMETPQRSDIDQALLGCALQWIDAPPAGLDIGRRELVVAHAVVASLAERSAERTLRVCAARCLHKLIDESLWWDFRCAGYAGARIVAGFLDARWACADFDREQLEQIYTSIQVEDAAGERRPQDGKGSYFRACTLHQAARPVWRGADAVESIPNEAGPVDDAAWLKDNLAIAELFREAIDTAESRRDVAVICYKLGRALLAAGSPSESASWLRRGMAALRPGMAARRGLVPDLEGGLFASSRALLERLGQESSC
jgi:hypothetical protein